MGRLFWKFFIASFSALVLAAIGAAVAVHVQWRASEHGRQPLPQVVLALAASTLRVAGPDALAEWLRDAQRAGGPRVYAVDARGEELLGRPLSQDQLAHARASAASAHPTEPARYVKAAGGDDYLLFLAPRPFMALRLPLHKASPESPQLLFPWPWLHIIAGTIASIAVSALLAWYMARPIRILRESFDAAAGGRLDTRVGARMGSRRDEIADLGRDFDRMAEQLQRVMSGQRRLLHDVSHELRSPLARVQAAVGLLRQDPAGLDEALSRIERECARLDELVGEVLTLARLESGTLGGKAEQLNFAEVVADVAEDARFEAHSVGKTVNVHHMDDAILNGRVQLLHRAVENIVRNAVKYTAAGTAVGIDLSNDSARSRAILTVSDSGPGMAREEMASMFEPFFRGRLAAETQGVGLGLAIAKRAIDVHGGTIRVENIASGGLRVTIELQLRSTAETDAAHPAQALQSAV